MTTEQIAGLVEALTKWAKIQACEDPFLAGAEDAGETLYGQAAQALTALSDHFADAGKMVTALQERVGVLANLADERAELMGDLFQKKVDAEARAEENRELWKAACDLAAEDSLAFNAAVRRAEARADALSAELEGLKKGSSSSRGALPSAVCPGGPDRWPRKGDRMWFLARNGHDYELDAAKRILPTDMPMTVKRCDVGGWSHTVEFEEFPGRHWNGVMFELRPSSEVQSSSPNVVSAGNPATDTINTSQNHPSTNGEG